MTLVWIGSLLVGMGLVCLAIGILGLKILRHIREEESRRQHQSECEVWRKVIEKKILPAIKSATWERR